MAMLNNQMVYMYIIFHSLGYSIGSVRYEPGRQVTGTDMLRGNWGLQVNYSEIMGLITDWWFQIWDNSYDYMGLSHILWFQLICYFHLFSIIYGIILPIDELIFFKMVIAPPTSNP